MPGLGWLTYTLNDEEITNRVSYFNSVITVEYSGSRMEPRSMTLRSNSFEEAGLSGGSPFFADGETGLRRQCDGVVRIRDIQIYGIAGRHHVATTGRGWGEHGSCKIGP
jgi:hypothetical protein